MSVFGLVLSLELDKIVEGFEPGRGREHTVGTERGKARDFFLLWFSVPAKLTSDLKLYAFDVPPTLKLFSLKAG